MIDREAGHVYICQCYLSNEWNSGEGPANKADDLLTAVSWLLNNNIKDIPVGIRSEAKELQDAIRSGEVNTLHLLFIHNRMASDNVRSSLATVASSAKVLIENDSVAVSASELDLGRVQHLYNSLTKQIVVDGSVAFATADHIPESGDGWKAIGTTISGVELHDLWQKHGDDLFSANIRGFLDMLSRKTSINRGILETVQLEPSRFWAFNNGVTVLTKKISTSPGKITALGVSVINGAQTTGVLGKAPRESAAKVRVPCRFIESNDDELIEEIITCNNTQNAIKSFDFRSNDPTQNKLRIEFQKYGITYVHRRQGANRLPDGAIQAESLAPYLAAFHDHFQIATRQRRTIFEDRSVYGKVFPPETSAEHIFLVQCLADAVGQYKVELAEKVRKSAANDPEIAANSFFSFSTSKVFSVAVIGRLASSVMDRVVPNLFGWRVTASKVKADRSTLVITWKLIIESLIPLIVGQSGGDVYGTVRSSAGVAEVATKVSFLVHSLSSSNLLRFCRLSAMLRKPNLTGRQNRSERFMRASILPPDGAAARPRRGRSVAPLARRLGRPRYAASSVPPPADALCRTAGHCRGKAGLLTILRAQQNRLSIKIRVF